jgi:hypothetical protein
MVRNRCLNFIAGWLASEHTSIYTVHPAEGAYRGPKIGGGDPCLSQEDRDQADRQSALDVRRDRFPVLLSKVLSKSVSPREVKPIG